MRPSQPPPPRARSVPRPCAAPTASISSRAFATAAPPLLSSSRCTSRLLRFASIASFSFFPKRDGRCASVSASAEASTRRTARVFRPLPEHALFPHARLRPRPARLVPTFTILLAVLGSMSPSTLRGLWIYIASVAAFGLAPHPSPPGPQLRTPTPCRAGRPLCRPRPRPPSVGLQGLPGRPLCSHSHVLRLLRSAFESSFAPTSPICPTRLPSRRLVSSADIATPQTSIAVCAPSPARAGIPCRAPLGGVALHAQLAPLFLAPASCRRFSRRLAPAPAAPSVLTPPPPDAGSMSHSQPCSLAGSRAELHAPRSPRLSLFSSLALATAARSVQCLALAHPTYTRGFSSPHPLRSPIYLLFSPTRPRLRPIAPFCAAASPKAPSGASRF